MKIRNDERVQLKNNVFGRCCCLQSTSFQLVEAFYIFFIFYLCVTVISILKRLCAVIGIIRAFIRKLR